ncbi:MAG TPA: cysteine--tRNA ligase [Bacilli bacterium]|nr:cysteine--tRNA ligase [Bacilli bacterium]
MELYNTLTKKIEEFIPNNNEVVKMYTCGPTVYHYAHIGNLRSYVEEDILEKTLNYLGYHVKRVMNITDVGHLTSDADTGEDKMLKGAKREHKTVLEIAKMYTDAFFKDSAELNIKKPEIVIPATSCIDEYIKIIEKLLNDGYAYQAGGNIYFDTSKLKEYYVLTNNQVNDMITGAREDVGEDINKKNKTDFVLWFTKSKFLDQELKWNSPWGVGYPGWHIECSGISIKYLGEYLDIHCGGVDNIFPHHTNEIAQSESYLGHKWCNYWFHVEHLNNQAGKMSKSSGEFLTLSLLKEKGYNPLAYRLFCLQSHYRKQLMFSYEGLDSTQIAYDKLKNKTTSLTDNGELNNEIFNSYDTKFKEEIANDLNTANTLTLLYDLLKDDNVNDKTKKELIKSWDQVLSLDLLKKDETVHADHDYIMVKIEERKKAKEEKNYALADQIRNNLLDKGIELIDTKDGTKYKVANK